MKQILEFLPIVLFFGAYQMDGETLTAGAWSHTFDGHFQRHCGLDDRHHRGLANHASHHTTKR